MIVKVIALEPTITRIISNTGTPGSSGVISVVAPITNTGTSSSAVLGVNQDGFSRIANLGYAQFDTTNTTSPTVPGRMAWNATDGTLDLYLKDGDVTLQVGQEHILRIVNKSGATLAEGAAVYVSGAQGQRVKVGLASSTGDTAAQNTIGLVTSSGGIANNAEGFVTLRGLVRNVDTQTWVSGDLLWLASTAGTYTNVEPVAPEHNIRIGWVIKDGPVGSILVDVLALSHLGELNDVLAPSPTDGQVLTFEVSTGLWKPKAISPSQVTGTAVITSDSRLSDARTPTAHASTHASAGSDALTLAQSQVTGLTTALSAKAPIASPTFTGSVTTPLTTAGYVTTTAGGLLGSVGSVPQADVSGLTASLAAKAALTASQTFTGTQTLTNTTGITPLVVNAVSGTTVDVAQIQTNGTNRFRVDSAGVGYLNGITAYTNNNINMANGFTQLNIVGIGVNSTAGMATVAPTAATTLGLLIRGYATGGAYAQTADLQQWQKWDGTTATTVAGINNIGQVFTGSTAPLIKSTFNAQLSIKGPTTTNAVPIAIFEQGSTATGSLSEWRGSGTETSLVKIDQFGSIITNSGGHIFAQTYAPGVDLLLKGATSQTGDLIQTQRSDGTILSGKNANGQIYSGPTTIKGTGVSITAVTYTSATVMTFTYAGTTSLVTVGQLATVAGTSNATYIGTWAVTAIGGSSGAWTFTVAGSGFTATASTGGTFALPAQASITASSAGTQGLVVKAATNQTANIQEWQNSSGTAVARIDSTGIIYPQAVFSNSGVYTAGSFGVLGEVNGGGSIRIGISTAASAPSANFVRLQVLAGTTGQKLVVVGPGGTAYTIVDNII